MAARYALQAFFFTNNVTGREEFIQLGASRDSVSSQAFTQTPASFWSTTPLVVGSQINPKRAAHLLLYPNT